eukprot:TRINITY_DN58081_c0_g1_i1.p1 TRINITY_DN58081_c0_g1~~TRINITY_DN58081_c0_g1_i1.p1  ORF type:complete len:181 (+),score=77.73 TRINITY_DN58081_c0_g1_i1:40-543(+)
MNVPWVVLAIGVASFGAFLWALIRNCSSISSSSSASSRHDSDGDNDGGDELNDSHDAWIYGVQTGERNGQSSGSSWSLGQVDEDEDDTFPEMDDPDMRYGISDDDGDGDSDGGSSARGHSRDYSLPHLRKPKHRRQWTHTNVNTGDSETRLHRKGSPYKGAPQIIKD